MPTSARRTVCRGSTGHLGGARRCAGGGSTANLLAVRRLHGLPEILAEAAAQGVILAGISAGRSSASSVTARTSRSRSRFPSAGCLARLRRPGDYGDAAAVVANRR
ncbi:Type 1 glutamine amidotransferase-like domain-containing protein [Actinotalea sp. K2]|uniref:Type 1 glutamine amidotransferase-like domain-containing protein n=1 Tax=Actinotalea sp. K2 TaxID=2939438 RepID=UPI0035A90579